MIWKYYLFDMIGETMIIAMTNLKGGSGKTTSTIGLACAAARDGKDVVVYDTDPQASAWVWADAAEANGDPLPFEVVDASIVTLNRKLSGLAGSRDKWVFVDCPPDGEIIDKASELADCVVVPTGVGAGDMVKTGVVVQTLERQGKNYAVLITQARPNTIALNETIAELNANDSSYFESRISLREDLRNAYGFSFGPDLFGYEAVYREIKEMMED